jgi:cell division protein FtsB
MASAPNARERPADARRPRVRPRVVAGGARGIRWDRVGRVALLIVLVGVVGLYVGPAITYVETLRESGQRKAEVRALRAENDRLKARRRALGRTATLEREARRLGLVKPGERAYIVKCLPGDPDELYLYSLG